MDTDTMSFTDFRAHTIDQPTLVVPEFPPDAIFFQMNGEYDRLVQWIVTRPDRNPPGARTCWERQANGWRSFYNQTEEDYCRHASDYEHVPRETAICLLGLDPATRLPEGF